MDISATLPVSAADASATTQRIPLQTLGQNDFLKLLVTQLTSQDPMNPQKDTEFIAQMAQFSALEQAKTMQTDIAKLRNSQELLQADGLLGRTVKLQGENGAITGGVVSAVQVEAGTPTIMINGQSYELSQVLSIAPTQAAK